MGYDILDSNKEVVSMAIMLLEAIGVKADITKVTVSGETGSEYLRNEHSLSIHVRYKDTSEDMEGLESSSTLTKEVEEFVEDIDNN